MVMAFIELDAYKPSGKVDERDQYRIEADVGSRRVAIIANGYQMCHLISVILLYNANRVDSTA